MIITLKDFSVGKATTHRIVEMLVHLLGDWNPHRYWIPGTQWQNLSSKLSKDVEGTSTKDCMQLISTWKDNKNHKKTLGMQSKTSVICDITPISSNYQRNKAKQAGKDAATLEILCNDYRAIKPYNHQGKSYANSLKKYNKITVISCNFTSKLTHRRTESKSKKKMWTPMLFSSIIHSS